MKKHYLCGLIILLSSFLYGQLDSTFYYKPDGSKKWWHIQKDVMSFRCSNNQQYTGSFNPADIMYQTYWSNDSRKMNEIHFTQSCTPMNQMAILNQIRTSPDFEIFAYAITETANVPCSINDYYTTDDQLLVLFQNTPTSAEVGYVEQAYDVDLIGEPSSALPLQGNYSYVFKVNVKPGDLYTAFEVAQQMVENDPALVLSAMPNVYNRNGLNCSVTDEMNLSPGNILGTWYIRNQGTPIWAGTNGTSDADADICECWADGYTGNGIKVGVIDNSSLEFDHPDLATISAAYSLDNPSPTQETSNFSLDPAIGHSMNVMSIIGATPNNTNLGMRFAVGAAYDADIHGYIASTIDAVEMTRGLQQALLDQVDIVNMSFRLPQDPFMDNAIANLISLGRPDPNGSGGFLGTIIIAGSGNDDLVSSHYPANHPDVIGVGGSNPRDYRWSANPPDGEGWTANSGQGSTYGPPDYNYDVVAPSELMMVADAVSYGSPGSYNIQLGTSFASPLVSSIAAIMLEKNPNQTYQEIRQRLRDGAEKVHPADYDYNAFASAPGYSEEMFYGRVSCSNSLNLVTVGIEEYAELSDLVLMTIEDNRYELILPSYLENGSVIVYSLNGSIVMDSEVEPNQESLLIDLTNISSGMYVLALKSNDVLIGMSKLVK